MSEIVDYTEQEEECSSCGRSTHLEISLLTGARACYNCHRQNPAEMAQRVFALEDMLRRERDRADFAERELAIASKGKEDILDQLRLERARLSFLSMDGIETSTGYDCTSVSLIGNGPPQREFIRRTNIRQAVDEMAKEIYGEDWISAVLACPNAAWREAPDAAEGINEWMGPRTDIWENHAAMWIPADEDKDTGHRARANRIGRALQAADILGAHWRESGRDVEALKPELLDRLEETIEAAYEGYSRLPVPLIHRRERASKLRDAELHEMEKASEESPGPMQPDRARAGKKE